MISPSTQRRCQNLNRRNTVRKRIQPHHRLTAGIDKYSGLTPFPKYNGDNSQLLVQNILQFSDPNAWLTPTGLVTIPSNSEIIMVDFNFSVKLCLWKILITL